MQRNHSGRRRISIVCLLVFSGVAFCLTPSGQLSKNSGVGTQAEDRLSFDGTAFGEQVVIGPNWLFMPDDNPVWASPSLNDSGWRVLSSSKPLSAYGLHNLRYGWYRKHILVRLGVQHLAIGVQNLHGSYELFVNGVLLGSAGDSAGMVKYTKLGMQSYSVPDRVIGQQGQVLLAIRVAFNAAGVTGRGTSTPIDATSRLSLIDERSAAHEASYIDVHNAADSVVLAFLSFTVGLVALALFLAIPTRQEYLAAAIALLAGSLELGSTIWEQVDASTFPLYVARYAFLAISNVALIEFVRSIVRQNRVLWLLTLEAFTFIGPIFALLAVLGFGSIYLAFADFFVPLLTAACIEYLLLTKGSLRGNIEARVLLPAILAVGLARLWDFATRSLYFAHVTPSVIKVPTLPLGSFRSDLFALADFLFYFTMLLFLVLRTVVIARERARIGAELEAANTTQQLLMSRKAQATPGFEVETVYHPASEVGGDFFFVSSIEEKAQFERPLLVVVGDVSGKGLTAAMRVAMILGVLGSEDSGQPCDILRHLNAVLWNDAVPGFTTTCCVRFEPDGRFILANAGHIAPYIDGREIETPPALPLGLVADQEYESVVGSLQGTQRMVLFSDGVVEAGSSTREILGFGRLSALLQQSAGAIADTARTFGQEDDITVVAIMRCAVALAAQ